jgi:4-hydroxy-tetrahydrodipicolinate reductase
MKLAIAGCAGRMGQALVKRVLETSHMELVAGSMPVGSNWVGSEVGDVVHASTPDAIITADIQTLYSKADAVLDFTTPDYSLELAKQAAATGKILICGTTGFSEAQKTLLVECAKKARIVHSGNMSIGVNLLAALVEKVSAMLPADAFDIEIDEMHHAKKVDAPSGTALLLGDAAAKGRGVSLTEVRMDARSGHTGERKAGTIGFSVRRGGDVVGDHTVMFAGSGERIELTHKSSSREIYASGAIRAALWAQDKKPGLYSMKEVLGF